MEIKKNGIYPNAQRGGYDLYVSGEFRSWALYLRDLKKIQKNPPAIVKYPNGKTVKVNF